MGNLCVIPARGGSKRIPRKNIRDFLGKPIIAYSIEAALNSGLFDEVMVSTDDTKIAEVARKYGANVPFMRSSKNSNDNATTVDVMMEVVENYREKDITFDNLCCIYPCAPLVSVDLLKNAFELMIEKQFDSVFPVIEYGFPIQRSVKVENSLIAFAYPEFKMTRSQDLEKRYHDAGQFYFMNILKTVKNNQLITENSGAVIISEIEGQDIDNEIDWKLAELKYKLIANEISGQI